MKYTTSIALLTAFALTALSGQPAIAQQHLFEPDHHSHGSIHTASGMLLGVYARTSHEGLKITSTIPGYSAEGRLFAGDILLKATAEGMPTFVLRSHQDMENAKSQIGPFREAAIEFFRPGAGTMYAWVTFMPIGGGAPHHDHDHPHVLHQQGSPVQGGQPFAHSQGSNGPFPDPLNSNNITPNAQIPPGGNPNNFQPKSGNPNNNVPFSGSLSKSPNNFSPHSSQPTTPNNFSPRSGRSSNTGKFQAEFRLESEKPGARLLFKNPGSLNLNQPQTNIPQSTLPKSRTFHFGGR